MWDHIARELGLQAFDLREEASIGPGRRADAILETDEARYIVEVEGRPAREEDLARLSLTRDIAENQGDGVPVVAVLAAPNMPNKVRSLAEDAGVLLVTIPASMAPSVPADVGKTPLTTEKSWAVVATLLGAGSAPSVRALAGSAGVSTGWTHRVVQELGARGYVERAAGSLRLVDAEGVLDLVSTERPFENLLQSTIETGIASIEEVALSLMLGFDRLQSETDGGKGPPTGAFVCGTTAAAEYTGYLIQGDRLDVYSRAVGPLEDLFDGQSGGVILRVYEPDREVTPALEIRGGLPCASKQQALLDVAGTGMAFRDLAHALLEAIQDG